MTQKKLRRRIFLIVSILIILGVCQEIWNSNNLLDINCFQIETEKVKQDIKLVVLSDLHEHQFGENNSNMIELVGEQQPDAILLLGDFLNDDSENADQLGDLIKHMQEISTVYFALGNHEIAYMEEQNAALSSQLEAAGAIVLDKEYIDVEVQNETVRIGGLYEYAFGFDNNEIGTKTFLEDFQDTELFKIMMSHRPDSFIFGNASNVWDIDLVVSGHNHGGQVVVPFWGGLFGGDQGYFPEYVHGMYQKDKINLFVTSGLGSNPKPLPRFNNRPEIAVVNISNK